MFSLLLSGPDLTLKETSMEDQARSDIDRIVDCFICLSGTDPRLGDNPNIGPGLSDKDRCYPLTA